MKLLMQGPTWVYPLAYLALCLILVSPFLFTAVKKEPRPSKPGFFYDYIAPYALFMGLNLIPMLVGHLITELVVPIGPDGHAPPSREGLNAITFVVGGSFVSLIPMTLIMRFLLRRSAWLEGVMEGFRSFTIRKAK